MPLLSYIPGAGHIPVKPITHLGSPGGRGVEGEGLVRGRESYPLFEVDPLLQGQRVSLGDDGDNVHHLA